MSIDLGSVKFELQVSSCVVEGFELVTDGLTHDVHRSSSKVSAVANESVIGVSRCFSVHCIARSNKGCNVQISHFALIQSFNGSGFLVAHIPPFLIDCCICCTRSLFDSDCSAPSCREGTGEFSSSSCPSSSSSACSSSCSS